MKNVNISEMLSGINNKIHYRNLLFLDRKLLSRSYVFHNIGLRVYYEKSILRENLYKKLQFK